MPLRVHMADIQVIPVRMGMVSAFLVRQDGVILVDTGPPGHEAVILEAMEKARIAPGDIRLILLTHGHEDHAGSAAGLRQRIGSPVAIHEKDAGKIREGRQDCLKATGIAGILFGLLIGTGREKRFPSCEPDIVFSDLLDLGPYGIQGRVIPMPGHTPGSSSLILENGDALVGDIMVPAIPSGKPALPFWAENREEAERSIGKVLSFHPRRIFPAHGGLIRLEQG